MQKANTNAYDQRTDDVSQFVNVDKAQQIGALDGFTFSLAERIAKQSSERNFTRDVMSQAFTGTSPYQLMNNLETEAAMADQNAAKLENRRLKLQSDLAAMSPEQADDTNYRAALNAYEQMLRNIPQAPQLERFGFSDTDKMMIGFALLMGANPADAIGKFVQTKMGFMDIQNRQTQDQFQIDQSLYRDQLRGLGDIVDIENQRLNRDQFSLDRQFGLQSQNINRELNAVNQAIDDDRLRLQTLNQNTAQRQRTLDNLWKTKGVASPDYENAYRDYVLQEAKDRGISVAEAERILATVSPGTQTQQAVAQTQNVQERQADRTQRAQAEAQRTKQREADRKQRAEAEARRAKQADERIRLQKERGQNAGRGRGGSGGRAPNPMAGEINADGVVPLDPGTPTINPNLPPKVVTQLTRELEKFENDIQTLRAEQRRITDKAARQKVEEKIQSLVVKRDARKERLGINKETPVEAIMKGIKALQLGRGDSKQGGTKPAEPKSTATKSTKHANDSKYDNFK